MTSKQFEGVKQLHADAQKKLEDSGLFADLAGPYDYRPVQFQAVLPSGVYVYAKARETRVLLEVYPCADDLADDNKRLARYEKKVPYDAGFMDPCQFADFIRESVEAYLSR